MVLNRNDNSLKMILKKKNIKNNQQRDTRLRKIFDLINNNRKIDNYVIFESVLFHREHEDSN